MINAYADHGMGKESLLLFNEIKEKQIKPDEIILLSLLNSCGHTGMVDEALNIYYSMYDQYGIKPNIQHMNTVVDVFARSGKLEDAEKFIKEKIDQPDIITWTAFLGGCRIYNDIERAKWAFNEALKLDEKNGSIYILMSNIYALNGREEDVIQIRNLMKEKGIKAIPGQTWITINNKIETFIANDDLNNFEEELKNEIYKESKSWISEI